MSKSMTKLTRLKCILNENNIKFKEFQSQLDDITEDFDKWIKESLVPVNSRNGNKTHFLKICEKSQDFGSDFELEDNQKKSCSSENIVRCNNTILNNIIIGENGGGERVKRHASNVARAMIAKQANEENLVKKIRKPEKFNQRQVKQEKLSILYENENNIKEEINTEKEVLIPTNVPKLTQNKNEKHEIFRLDNDGFNIDIKKEKIDNVVELSKKLITRGETTVKNKTKCDTLTIKPSSLNYTDHANDVEIQIIENMIFTVNDSRDESIENNDTSNFKSKGKDSLVDKSINELPEKTKLKNCNKFENKQFVNENAEVGKIHKDKNVEANQCKTPVKLLNAKKQQLLFNPLDSVKKKIEALEKLNSSEFACTPLKTRVTRTKTKALKIAALFTKNEENINEKGSELRKNEKLKTKECEKDQLRDSYQNLNTIVQKQQEEIVCKKINVEEQKINRKETTIEKQIKIEKQAQLKKLENGEHKHILFANKTKESEVRNQNSANIVKQQTQKQESLKRMEVLRKIRKDGANELHQQNLQQEKAKKVLRKVFKETNKAKVKAKIVSNAKQLLKIKQCGIVNNYSEVTPTIKTKTILNLDTDDETEDEEDTKRVIPMWSKSIYREIFLIKQIQIPNNIVSNLFGSKPTSINLRDVFPNISASRLKRQSSAIWTTPPRYSLMPKY